MPFCPPLPQGHPRILDSGFYTGANQEVPSLVTSTACWRGYQGTWEIRDGRFYLVALCGRYRLGPGEPLLADWFSGVLRVPKGNLLEYVHMGFSSIYDQEAHISIDNGRVVKTQLIDHRDKLRRRKSLLKRLLSALFGGE